MKYIGGWIIMGKFTDKLTEMNIDFIAKQKMFFVATSPTSEGRINISPKGYDSLKVIDSNTLAYVDYAGSGNETANHLNENGRITVMWCSYDKEPLILRAYGIGRIIENESSEFASLLDSCFQDYSKDELRQLFVIAVESVQSSCGWGVPFMDFIDDRSRLKDYANKTSH
jgi:hypothetical protein